MKDEFYDPLFREINVPLNNIKGNVIKADSFELSGITRISVEQESDEGVKVVLKKDADDTIKEIRFLCTCGQSKAIVLNYNDD